MREPTREEIETALVKILDRSREPIDEIEARRILSGELLRRIDKTKGNK